MQSISATSILHLVEGTQVNKSKIRQKRVNKQQTIEKSQ